MVILLDPVSLAAAFALMGTAIASLYWGVLLLGLFRIGRGPRQPEPGQPMPALTVIIPAHDEAAVIEQTVRAVAASSYPALQVLVVDDGSQDATPAILARLERELPGLRVLAVPRGQGGRGKSCTLNRGLEFVETPLYAVYDADNTPERDALVLLVQVLLADNGLAAVNGQVRTRNAAAGLLTRFISAEFIVFQWMFQAARWRCFGCASLMGTNYVARTALVRRLGGYDEACLVDDVELSMRLRAAGWQIRWIPDALTWEQEPERLGVWFRQRVRWALGTLQVLQKHLPTLVRHPQRLGQDFLHLALTFLVFLPTVCVSHLLVLAGFAGLVVIPEAWRLWQIWGLALLVYQLATLCCLWRARASLPEFLAGCFGYFTYAQLFLPVALTALYRWGLQNLRGGRAAWSKTPRFQEHVSKESVQP